MVEAQAEFDKELDAIKTIANVLQSLDPETQRTVLDYVARRLKINLGGVSPRGNTDAEGATPGLGHVPPPVDTSPAKPRVVDIRSFREEKHPQTDVQMAAIVAYYLAELAPPERRKTGITSEDISMYFKQAGHPLPKEPRFTLVNAKAAGYFENVGKGEYKLNPVGHNLVAHSLPKNDSADGVSPRRNLRRVKAATATKGGKRKGR